MAFSINDDHPLTLKRSGSYQYTLNDNNQTVPINSLGSFPKRIKTIHGVEKSDFSDKTVTSYASFLEKVEVNSYSAIIREEGEVRYITYESTEMLHGLDTKAGYRDRAGPRGQETYISTTNMGCTITVENQVVRPKNKRLWAFIALYKNQASTSGSPYLKTTANIYEKSQKTLLKSLELIPGKSVHIELTKEFDTDQVFKGGTFIVEIINEMYVVSDVVDQQNYCVSHFGLGFFEGDPQHWSG